MNAMLLFEKEDPPPSSSHEPKKLEPYDSTDELDTSTSASFSDEEVSEDHEEWRALELEYERQWTLFKSTLLSFVLPLLGKLLGRRLALTCYV
ncbi:hypothetical protein HMI55_006305 [Coelomomyces lativittatus]|nr:hypothetical protein HMI55_006305 [Coelomomyces lativittatus]